MGRSPAVVVLLHPRLDLLHGVRPVLHELGLHEAARGALGLGIHHGSSSAPRIQAGRRVWRSWGFAPLPLLERTVGSVRRVALRDVHHSWRGQWARFGESLSGMYTTPGQASGLGSGCTTLCGLKVGSVRRVALRDVHHSRRGKEELILGMYTTPGEDSELSSESRFLGCTPLLERTVGSVRRVSLRGSGMYTTPGEDSGLSSESRSQGCTPLPERIVGSTGRVGSGDVHHSWRGRWAQCGESLFGMYTAPGEDSGLSSDSRSPRIRDVHHSWRGQWTQFGESLSGMYTAPGEVSGLSSESRSLGCTPLLEKTVGSTGKVGCTPLPEETVGSTGRISGIHTSLGGDWDQHGRSLLRIRTILGGDSLLRSTPLLLDTFYIAGASRIFTKTQQQQQRNYSVKYRLARALRREKQHSVYVLFQWSLLQSQDETSERRPPDSRRPTHGLDVCDLTSVKRKPSTPSKKASSCCQPSRSRKRRSFEPQTKSVT